MACSTSFLSYFPSIDVRFMACSVFNDKMFLSCSVFIDNMFCVCSVFIDNMFCACSFFIATIASSCSFFTAVIMTIDDVVLSIEFSRSSWSSLRVLLFLYFWSMDLVTFVISFGSNSSRSSRWNSFRICVVMSFFNVSIESWCSWYCCCIVSTNLVIVSFWKFNVSVIPSNSTIFSLCCRM